MDHGLRTGTVIGLNPYFLDVCRRPVSFVIGVCGQIARGHNSVPEESQALWRSFLLDAARESN
jgi:hypothetical protein